MIARHGLQASLLLLFSIMMTACSEHSDFDVTEHTVDFRFSGGIAELYDCDLRQRYFLVKTGAYDELLSEYAKLKLPRNDDAFLHVMGYVKKENIIEGIDPVDVFVVTELLSVDTTRGCSLKG
ncbi:MAG: hypothetical protein KAH22_06010 [Thiotrichaceae bacterium]|nr:hypothetical protein [Thiotrichaceae bacterium]